MIINVYAVKVQCIVCPSRQLIDNIWHSRLIRYVQHGPASKDLIGFCILKNIPVQPAKPGAVMGGLSTESLSSYLDLAIDGPLAYDNKYGS